MTAGRPPKHGARALAKHLAAGSLDGRTWIAQALKSIRDDLARDRGGLEHCSAAERLLIDMTSAQVLIVNAMQNYILTRDPINDKGELLSVLRKGYATHAANLSRNLQALGLKADKADKVPSLASYLEQRSASNSNGSGDFSREKRPENPEDAHSATQDAGDADA